MHAVYPATYRDAFGQESTELHNDGRDCRLMVRGIEFSGSQFDGLWPPPETEPSALSRFVLDPVGHLSGFDLQFPMRVEVITSDKTTACQLDVRITVPPPSQSKASPWATACFALTVGDRTFRSSGNSGHFELELLQIQKSLPDETFIKACINCAYSDYSPSGQEMIGMMCFRHNKAGYRTIRSKRDMFRVSSETNIEWVQETYLCSEFEWRLPGTGYRG